LKVLFAQSTKFDVRKSLKQTKGNMKIECWASCIGGCSDKQSREHLISNCLFPSGRLIVEGLPWFNKASKRITSNSLTSNILCAQHNNALSPVDAEGGRIIETIREFVHLRNTRRGLKAEQFETMTYHLDGKMFQRWFMKTVINITQVIEGPLEWFENSSPVKNPPISFVEVAYGIKEMERPYGLFQSNSVNEVIAIEDAVSFQPLLVLNNKIIGFEFRFGGFKFMLWLCNIYPNKWKGLHSSLGNIWGNLEEPLRPGSINYEVDGKTSQVINFIW
jgi:hypothetical protein